MLAFDFTNFIGRFHPILVHLPIGFLILAILLEWYQRFHKKKKISSLIGYAWLLGGIGGAFAAFCGWYLGETGLYFEEDLFLHRWLGIAIVVISFIGWWFKKKPENYANIIHHGVNLLIIGLLTIEGHLGGNLTHGASYLFEFAPEPLKELMLDTKEETEDLSKKDSVLVYNDLVKPIFENKCFACHNNEVQRGNLNMATEEGLLAGGDKGPSIVPSNIFDSELFSRVTLSQKNIKFMPPVGEPLTYDEIQVVEWWIDKGASFKSNISETEIPETIKPVLIRRYALDTEPKPWYESVDIIPLDSTAITKLEKEGFTVKVLGASNPLIDVKYRGKDLTLEKMQSLELASEHITWLSLGSTNVVDEWLKPISNLPNLTRLQLEKTAVSDAGINQLENLDHLEALNLYRTQVTNASLDRIKSFKELKRVYLWDTKVTPQMAKALKTENETLKVIMGEN